MRLSDIDTAQKTGNFYHLKNNILAIFLLFIMLIIIFSNLSLAASFPLAVKVEAITKDGNTQALSKAYVHMNGRFSTTNNKGIAYFEGLPAGTYHLSIRHPGHHLIERRYYF